MKSKIIILALLFSACMPLMQPLATPMVSTYYVATTGNDANPGTQAQPWKTIQKVANTVNAGDTVIFSGGTYELSSHAATVFTRSGSASQPITLRSASGQQAIIKSGDWTVIRILNADYYIIDGLEFTGGGKGIEIQGGSHNVIRNCALYGLSQQGVYIGTEATRPNASYNLVENCDIHDNGWEGVYIKSAAPDTTVTGNRVINNRIHGNKSEAVQNTAQNGGTNPDHTTISGNLIYDNFTDTSSPGTTWGTISTYGDYLLIENNVIYNNKGGDINSVIASGGSNIVVRNNLIYGNVGQSDYDAAIWVEKSSAHIYNNTIYDANYGIYIKNPLSIPIIENNIIFKVNKVANASYTGTNFTADPHFVSPDTGDFHLQTGSPACGMGAFPCETTGSPTASPTPSPSATIPPTASKTPTIAPSITPTRTATATQTTTPTKTATRTATKHSITVNGTQIECPCQIVVP
jgi:parallel beta-helix repeat protein